MERTRQFAPRVEGLERKELLSGTHDAPFIPRFRGTLSGTFEGSIVPYSTVTADAERVSGTGRVAGLGDVTVAGFFRVPSAIVPRDGGTLLLTSDRGAVTVNLLGRGFNAQAPAPFGESPRTFAFVVASGTGYGRRIVQFGRLTLSRTITNGTTAPGLEAGTFTATIR